MSVERTISIIKPDAVAKNVIGDVYNRFEKAGLRIVAARMLQLTREQAGLFEAVIDVANDIFCHSVWLDDRNGAFNGHQKLQ